MIKLCLFFSIFLSFTAFAKSTLPVVEESWQVVYHLNKVMFADIFFADRLSERKIKSSLLAKARNFFRKPEHAIYSGSLEKYRNKDLLKAKDYNDLIVHYTNSVGLTKIGVAEWDGKSVDTVVVNDVEVHIDNIGGVLVWNSPVYRQISISQHAELWQRMYVLDDTEYLHFDDYRTAVYPNYKLVTSEGLYSVADRYADVRLPEGVDSIAGTAVAVFSDNNYLMVAEYLGSYDLPPSNSISMEHAARLFSTKTACEWCSLQDDGEQLQVYFVKPN